MKPSDRRDGSVVKNSDCISRERFSSQHAHDCSHMKEIQHSLLAAMITAHIWFTHIHSGKMHTHVRTHIIVLLSLICQRLEILICFICRVFRRHACVYTSMFT